MDGLGTTVSTENIGIERQACTMQDYPSFSPTSALVG